MRQLLQSCNISAQLRVVSLVLVIRALSFKQSDNSIKLAKTAKWNSDTSFVCNESVQIFDVFELFLYYFDC